MKLYIDPGTGSMLFAILIGIISAVTYLLSAGTSGRIVPKPRCLDVERISVKTGVSGKTYRPPQKRPGKAL